MDFYIDGGMIHIADTKVARRYGDYFIRQIHKFEEINRVLKTQKIWKTSGNYWILIMYVFHLIDFQGGIHWEEKNMIVEFVLQHLGTLVIFACYFFLQDLIISTLSIVIMFADFF